MYGQIRNFLAGSLLSFLCCGAYAAKDGELWEVGMQSSRGGGSLGPIEVNKLCFPATKDFKEPPQKDDPNCKTEYKTIGKKTTFKSVCKDSDSTLTSSGLTEELAPYHYKSDVTITQESSGESRLQFRQVGYVKRLGAVCDTNAMFERLRAPAVGIEPASSQALKNSSPENETRESVTQETSNPTAKAEKTPAESPAVRDAVEAGKSLLKGLLKF